MHMHFANHFRVIASIGQGSRKHMRVIPGNTILITNSVMVFLGKTGKQRSSGGNAARTGTVCIWKISAFCSERIQIWRFDVWMPGDS